MKSRVLLVLLGVGTLYRAYRYADFAYASVVKEPIYATGISNQRFIQWREHRITTIEGEGNDAGSRNSSLSSIDIDSFHKIGSSGAVITEYADKNYRYTLHDGEEKLMLREPL